MSLWSLRYQDFDPRKEKLRETLCTVGNGYFATRGAAAEAKVDGIHYPGTYIAGCYNRLASVVAGRTIENESLVNLPNWLPLTFELHEGQWFDLQRVQILDYEQELDMKKGLLIRKVRFKDDQERITRLTQTRLAHMEDPHIGGLKSTIVAENWSGNLRFITALDGRVENLGVKTYRQFSGKHLLPVRQSVSQNNTMFLMVKTNQSNIEIAEAAKATVRRNDREVNVRRKPIIRSAYVGQEFTVRVKKKEPISIEKIVAIYTSKDRAISECGQAAMKGARNAPDFSQLVRRQELFWKHLWSRFRVRVEGDDRAALTVHAHTFHLLQTISPNSIDLDVGVPARGLHGEAYRGHVFWDELFVFPVLNIHLPDLTRSLLMYRYRRLDEARLLASQRGFRGALYPWESASDGREVTPILQFNSISRKWSRVNTCLQWHVNAAIAFNIWRYFQVSDDTEFLSLYGAEMFLEIARFYASIARYNESTGRYEIRGIMGPDEYHDAYPHSDEVGIKNNAYTNIMAVWVLGKALEVLRRVSMTTRDWLLEKLQLEQDEISRWEEISRKMFVPIQDDGIISEFQGYEKLKEFDWQAYRKKYKNIQDLAGILTSEGDSTNNYKVSKQADVLMLFYLFSSEELKELFTRLGYPFNKETIPKNIEYYAKRTSHGSTLSRIVHSWIFARLDRERSWQIAKEALESDLSDIQGGTTPEGIHIGAMAGTVEIFQRCYTGLVTRDDVLWLNPLLPSEIKKVSFPIFYRGHTFQIELGARELKIKSFSSPAPAAKVGLYGKVMEITPGTTKRFRLKKSQGRSNKKKQQQQRKHYPRGRV